MPPTYRPWALRYLRRDALRAARESTDLFPLSVPSRLPLSREELPAKMPAPDSLSIVLSAFQPSVAHPLVIAPPRATCAPLTTPCVARSNIAAPSVSRALTTAPLFTCVLTTAHSLPCVRTLSPVLTPCSHHTDYPWPSVTFCHYRALCSFRRLTENVFLVVFFELSNSCYWTCISAPSHYRRQAIPAHRFNLAIATYNAKLSSPPVSSPLAITALRAASGSGAGRTQALCPTSPVASAAILHPHPGPPPHLKHLADLWEGFSLDSKKKPAAISMAKIIADIKSAEVASAAAAL